MSKGQVDPKDIDNSRKRCVAVNHMHHSLTCRSVDYISTMFRIKMLLVEAGKVIYRSF